MLRVSSPTGFGYMNLPNVRFWAPENREASDRRGRIEGREPVAPPSSDLLIHHEPGLGAPCLPFGL